MANIGSCGDDTTNPFSTVNEQPVATTMTDSDLSRTAKKQHMQDLLQLVEITIQLSRWANETEFA